MRQLIDIFFLYIIFPTMAIAYLVGMWSFIVWTIKIWLRGRREKLDAQNRTGGEEQKVSEVSGESPDTAREARALPKPTE
jgi:hypothetical protein